MKAKSKEAPKSKRGEKRIQRAVEQRREKLREAAPDVYSNLDEEYETPEGLPTLEQFAIERDVKRAYGEAHPMQGATKMVDLGPIMFERWLGAKRSADGVNYRTPYYRTGELNFVGADVMKNNGSASTYAETFGGSKQNPTVLAEDSTVAKYKPAHKQFQVDKPLLRDIMGTIGSVFPPANFLLQGGASIGGRNIPEASIIPAVAALYRNAMSYGDREVSSIAENNANAVKSLGPAGAASTLGLMALAGSMGDLVVPTSGIGLNPFMREARQIRRETREDLRNLSEAQSRSMAGKDTRMQAINKRADADEERLIRLYEKKYDTKVKKKGESPTTYSAFGKGGILKTKKK